MTTLTINITAVNDRIKINMFCTGSNALPIEKVIAEHFSLLIQRDNDKVEREGKAAEAIDVTPTTPEV